MLTRVHLNQRKVGQVTQCINEIVHPQLKTRRTFDLSTVIRLPVHRHIQEKILLTNPLLQLPILLASLQEDRLYFIRSASRSIVFLLVSSFAVKGGITSNEAHKNKSSKSTTDQIVFLFSFSLPFLLNSMQFTCFFTFISFYYCLLHHYVNFLPLFHLFQAD